MTTEQLRTLTGEIIASVKHDLSEKYFLIPRNAWWAFLGGALAFAVGVGFVSYQSALKAVADPNVHKAIQTIYASEKIANASVAKINEQLNKSSSIDSRLSQLETEGLRTGSGVTELKKQLAALHIEKVADYSWTRDSGQWNTKLIQKDEGFAAITSIGGEFDSWDSKISVTIDKDGFWRPSGNPKGGDGPGYGATVSVFRLSTKSP